MVPYAHSHALCVQSLNSVCLALMSVCILIRVSTPVVATTGSSWQDLACVVLELYPVWQIHELNQFTWYYCSWLQRPHRRTGLRISALGLQSHEPLLRGSRSWGWCPCPWASSVAANRALFTAESTHISTVFFIPYANGGFVTVGSGA